MIVDKSIPRNGFFALHENLLLAMIRNKSKKNKNAMDFIGQYSRAVEAITKSHYVDDLIDSTHTPDEAIQLINDIQLIHKRAGFELCSFNSNSSEILTA